MSVSRPTVIVFGRRGAGKTEFVAACSRVSRHAHFLDTDSDADERALAEGTVPESFLQADGLAVTIDATTSDEEIDATAGAVIRYLQKLESVRTHERSVAGWPVAIVLTKCDALLERGDVLDQWLRRIDERTESVRTRFDAAFAAELDPGFGEVDLSVFATATRSPAIAGAPLDASGGIGIVPLAQSLAGAARRYRVRTMASNRRLSGTAIAAFLLLGAFLAASGAAWLIVPQGPDDRLTARVRSYQAKERPPAVRLSDARRPRNRAELTAIREDSGFADLHPDLKEYVLERLAEFDRYEAYAATFRRPAAAECRSSEELDRLAAELQTTLAPPPDDAHAWAETEAVRLRDKWARDIDLLRAAESRIYDWTRTLVRRTNELLFAGTLDRSWRNEIAAVLRDADAPPFPHGEPIPGSSEVPTPGGRMLTYDAAYEFDRVDVARRDWEYARDRITRLRDLADAVGLTGDSGRAASLLEWPELPSDKGAFERFATERLARIRLTLPALSEEPSQFALSLWPDAAREELKLPLVRSVDRAVRQLRERIRADVLSAGMGRETAAGWQQVRTTSLTQPWMRDWGKLLHLLSRLTDERPVNPVEDMIAFLGKPSFSLAVQSIEVTIPDSLRPDRFEPNAEITLAVNGAALPFKRIGSVKAVRGERTYRFVVDSNAGRPNVTPGEPLVLSLAGTVAGSPHELIWDRGRSSVYLFDRIALEPRFTEPNGRSERATGVIVRVEPEGAWPVLPVLVPDLTAGMPSSPVQQ
jgi:HAMP domain-containing protein